MNRLTCEHFLLRKALGITRNVNANPPPRSLSCLLLVCWKRNISHISWLHNWRAIRIFAWSPQCSGQGEFGTLLVSLLCMKRATVLQSPFSRICYKKSIDDFFTFIGNIGETTSFFHWNMERPKWNRMFILWRRICVSPVKTKNAILSLSRTRTKQYSY